MDQEKEKGYERKKSKSKKRNGKNIGINQIVERGEKKINRGMKKKHNRKKENV